MCQNRLGTQQGDVIADRTPGTGNPQARRWTWPDGRSADISVVFLAAKQKTVVYLSGRGQQHRCFCRRALIALVMQLHQPGSANAANSVCLCREQERALRFWPIVRPCPTVSLGSPVPSVWRPVSDRIPPSHSMSVF